MANMDLNNEDRLALQALMAEVWDTIIQLSMPRRLLQNIDLQIGGIHKLRTPSTGYCYSQNGQPDEVYVTKIKEHRSFYPPEYDLVNVLTEDEKSLIQTLPKDLSSNDVFERIREHSLYKLLLKKELGREEAITKKLLTTAAGPCTTFKDFTKDTLNLIIRNMGCTVSSIFIGHGLYQDQDSFSTFGPYFTPVPLRNLHREGFLGFLYGGIKVYTDNFRPPDLRILDPGEVFIMTHPHELGAISQRRFLQMVQSNSQISTIQIQSQAVVNNKDAVCYGIKM